MGDESKWDRLFVEMDKQRETLNGIHVDIAKVRNDQEHMKEAQKSTSEKVTKLFERTENNAKAAAVIASKLDEHVKASSESAVKVGDSEGMSNMTKIIIALISVFGTIGAAFVAKAVAG